MKKYKLSTESYYGNLYRVIALRDFNGVKIGEHNLLRAKFAQDDYTCSESHYKQGDAMARQKSKAEHKKAFKLWKQQLQGGRLSDVESVRRAKSLSKKGISINQKGN